MKENVFDLSLLERVNPVSSTAKMTVYQLSSMGYEDAKKIVDSLHLQYDATQNSASFKISKEMMLNSAIMLETRYLTCEQIALDSKAKTIVDLPCGYMPRAKSFAEKGISYYGLDLPAVILEAEPAVTNLIDDNKKNLVHFHGVDATNGNSLEQSLIEAEGPLCILTEGLLMYFTDSELGAICDNIKSLLERHGGFWLSADPETSLQFFLTLQPILGEHFNDALKASKERVQEKSDVKVGNNALTIKPQEGMENGIKKAMEFLASHGLKAERLSVSEYMPKINSLDSLPLKQAETIKDNMKKVAYWKITPIKEGNKTKSSEIKFKNFGLKYNVEGNVLYLELKGRVDSLTSPNLLQSYEKIKEEYTFDMIDIDCKELDYISSAGLRVLLIMIKEHPDRIKLLNTNSYIKKILNETGFDTFLVVAD